MAGETRLERRIRRDFPEPGSAHSVLDLLDDMPRTAGHDEDVFRSERIRAAVILLAGGDIGRLRDAIALGATDWRDLLVAAELANADWPDRLDQALGPETL